MIKLLLATFQATEIAESPVNDAIMDLAKNIEKISMTSMYEVNAVETIEEESLDFQEPFKGCKANVIEDSIWYKDEKDLHICSRDAEELSHDYKKKAVDYWRSGKTKLQQQHCSKKI